MSQNVSFNLVDEPWIRVRGEDGEEREVSLLELFEQAPHIKCLANDLATQDFVILRVLLDILQRAISPALDDDDDPAEVWGRLWNASELPINKIREYLEDQRDRFDLFDEKKPFMQVAGLQMLNEKMRGSGVWKIIADVPDGDPLFSLRSAKETVSLSFAEAARWLVHAQAYDTSGIKSATIGDSLASSGRRYAPKDGIGLGWAGRLGGIYLEGNTLRETLLLNFVVRDIDNFDLFPDDDKPSWEKECKNADARAVVPSGRADLYTWQLRRARLIPEEGRVVDVILTYGDLLKTEDAHLFEPMTVWRCSMDKEVAMLRPYVHQSDRALWRGLDSIFGDALANGKPSVLRPDLMEWLSYLASRNEGRQLSWNWLLKIHAVGFKYDDKLSAVDNAIDDYLELSPFLLSKEGEPLVLLAKECVSSTSQAINALSDLAVNLRLASGEHITDVKDTKRVPMSRAYFEVDSAFRSWFAGLGKDSDANVERALWRRKAHSIVKAGAGSLLSGIGSEAITGAPIKDKKGNVIGWMTASKAEALFNSRLREALPLEEDVETKKEAR